MEGAQPPLAVDTSGSPLQSTPEHQPAFQLGSFSIDEEVRPLKVVVIGAGYSGITAAIRIPQHIKNVHLTVYEKHAGVGGTWFANRYPGIACDIPAHSYQFLFEPESQWSAFYAPGAEIQQYIHRVAEKYKLFQYIKLSHELSRAQWDETTRKWNLRIKNLLTGEDVEDTADIVLNCMGGLERWSWPKIDGLDSFNGRLEHSAAWPKELEVGRGGTGEDYFKGKRGAVIGNGSSAIQIVPVLQPLAARLDNYVRAPAWITATFASDELEKLHPTQSNHFFTDEQKKRLKEEDPEYHFKFRESLEIAMNTFHGGAFPNHPRQQFARKAFTALMQERLQKKPWLEEFAIPTFPVGCRRFTPGPGYLEALVEDNVELVHDNIKRLTSSGIETVDGQHREYDVIICATGFTVDWRYKAPIIGRNGLTLQDRFTPLPESYLSIATDGFPNWFHIFGPNSGLASGSLLALYELEVGYVIQAMQKMQRERIAVMEVKQGPVKEFQEYVKAYFQTTVFASRECHSWYKMDSGDVVGLWPGSCLHALHTLEHPRWEDWDYTRIDNEQNRFHWLGDGWSDGEKHMRGDRAWYLKNVDYPPLPE